MYLYMMYLYMYPFQLLLSTPAIPFPPMFGYIISRISPLSSKQVPQQDRHFPSFWGLLFCCQTPFGKHI